MLQFIFCLFGLHGVTEIDYAFDEKVTDDHNCLNEIK